MTVIPPQEKDVFTPAYWRAAGKDASMFSILSWLGLSKVDLDKQIAGLQTYFHKYPEKAAALPPNIATELEAIGVQLPSNEE